MLKILHVEDSALLAEYVKRRCLGRLEVDRVGDLAAAKEKLKNGVFDILLVDLKLPDSNGLQTVKSLSTYNLPIIILTANQDDFDVEELVEAGADDYIIKADLKNIDLVGRIKFIFSRNSVINTKAMGIAAARFNESNNFHKRSSLSFSGINAMKPYLSCSLFAG